MPGLGLRVRGLKSPNNYPNVKLSTFEQAIYSLPGLKFWMRPEARFEPRETGPYKGIRDRVGIKDSGLSWPTAPYSFAVGGINGAPALKLLVGTLQGLKYPNAGTDLQYMLTEAGYSIVAVVKMSGDAGFFKIFEAYNNIISFIVGSDQKLYLDHNGAATNTSTTIDTNPHILSASWNPTSGNATFRKDGVAMTVSGSAAKSMIDLTGASSYGIGTTTGANNGQTGTIGDVLIFDRDITRAENIPISNLLLTTLGAERGITVTTA